MSAEDNKKIALSFWENFSTGKAEAALALLDDNATWWIAGKPELFPLAGTKTKAQFTEMLKGIGAAMPKGLRVTPKAITAEGDRVAIEAESYGELANGKVYNNLYHVLMEIRNGKIQAVREYMDTQHAHAVLT